MSMFRSSNSATFDKINNLSNLEDLNYRKIIPVTRYANSLQGGIFYDNINRSKYLGTFYYNEPESNTFLSYNTSISYKNKYEAYMNLKEKVNMDIIEITQLEQKMIEYFLSSNKIGYKILRNEIKVNEDLMYTPLEIINFLTKNNLDLALTIYEDYIVFDELLEIFPENLINENYINEDYDGLSIEELREEFHDKTNEEINNELNYTSAKIVFYSKLGELANSISQISRFCGKWLGMYAIEDCFDQILVHMCNQLEIDILILEKSVGSFGFITEILDCRDRKSSFGNLIFS